MAKKADLILQIMVVHILEFLAAHDHLKCWRYVPYRHGVLHGLEHVIKSQSSPDAIWIKDQIIHTIES